MSGTDLLRHLGADSGWSSRRRRTPIPALHVDDVAAARAELEAKGVEFTGDIFDTGVCHMALFTDPDGNYLMLHHRYADVNASAPAPLGARRELLANLLGQHEAHVLVDGAQLGDVLGAALAEELDEAARPAPRGRWRRR